VADERRERKSGRAFFCNEVEVVGYGPRRSSDLSVGGMFIESIAGYPLGTVLQLRFKLKEEDPMPIAVQARVLYSANGIGVGLEFLDLAPDDRTRIARLVSE
jgi:PilZ domain